MCGGGTRRQPDWDADTDALRNADLGDSHPTCLMRPAASLPPAMALLSMPVAATMDSMSTQTCCVIDHRSQFLDAPGAPRLTSTSCPRLSTTTGRSITWAALTAVAGVSNITRIYTVATNTWTTGAPMPATLTDQATALWNGIIYVAAGYDGIGAVNTLYAYNIAANSWTTLAPLPQALFLPGFGTINGKLYIASGNDGISRIEHVVHLRHRHQHVDHRSDGAAASDRAGQHRVQRETLPLRGRISHHDHRHPDLRPG